MIVVLCSSHNFLFFSFKAAHYLLYFCYLDYCLVLCKVPLRTVHCQRALLKRLFITILLLLLFM